MLGKSSTVTVWKCQVKTIPAISRGRLQAPLLLLPSQSAGNTSPAHPGHSLTSPVHLESRKGQQRLGSREIKEPSIFRGEKEKGRVLTVRTSLSKGCENSLCQANSMTWLLWANGDSPLERMKLQHSLPSPLSKHRDRRLQSISREAGTALHPICSSTLPGKE